MADFSLPLDTSDPNNGDERAISFNCFLLRQKYHSMAMNIAKTTIPQITPAMMGPFGIGLGISTTTVVVSLRAADVVDTATAV